MFRGGSSLISLSLSVHIFHAGMYPLTFAEALEGRAPARPGFADAQERVPPGVALR